jgi:hypothetical protein
MMERHRDRGKTREKTRKEKEEQKEEKKRLKPQLNLQPASEVTPRNQPCQELGLESSSLHGG